MSPEEIDLWHMRRALQLAAQGEGFVEPNPMVGCVIAHGAEIIGEGWHRRFGQAHAEVEALRMAGARAAGATMYVTLEPCCHQGKTPPCTEAIIAAGVRRVVAALTDPFPAVSGGGLRRLREAGLQVSTGLLAAEAERLMAPYLKLLGTGMPWVIAKWAMTLDGKLFARDGSSRWISSEAARAAVHRLRGRVDAIVIGSRTAQRDDPLLTARPPGPRIATRIVLDSSGRLSSESQLVRTAGQFPLMAAVGPECPPANRHRLQQAGCEVLVCQGQDHIQRLRWLLAELGKRRFTNVLFEGGSQVFGALLDGRLIDEVHVFIAPKLLGGAEAGTAIAGRGIETIEKAVCLDSPVVEQLEGDVYLRARVRR